MCVCVCLCAGDDPLGSVAGVHQTLKLTILRLISLTVDHPSPNMTHLLLGYETRSEKSVADTTLQDPGPVNISINYFIVLPLKVKIMHLCLVCVYINYSYYATMLFDSILSELHKDMHVYV